MARHSSPRGPAPARDTAFRPRPSGARDQIVTSLMLAAGVWLLLSAWLLDYPFNDATVDAQRNETGVGIVVVLTAGARMVRPRGWVSDLIVLALGVWLVVAPFVLDYGGENVPGTARTNEVVLGIVLIALAAVSLLLLSRIRRTNREDAG